MPYGRCHNSSKVSWTVTWYKFRLSNKSLSMLESFNVVNLMMCVVLTDFLSEQCLYVVHDTTLTRD